MTPLEFLKEEFENVQLALNESLRHEYGPEQTSDYYNECAKRLLNIKNDISSLAEADTRKIFAYLVQIERVANFVSLIERSRLGEFSWPFSHELRNIAQALFTETDLGGSPLPPIIHVISEGNSYRIINEGQVPIASSRRRFLVVAFPRALKSHALFHALFGHELGHTALYTPAIAETLRLEVLPHVAASKPFGSLPGMNNWVNSPTAPEEVKNELKIHQQKTGKLFAFTTESRNNWLIELLCDLFGIFLFGPAFFAAHRAYLLPLHPSPYAIRTTSLTHPPFAIRHKMLVQVMKKTGWHKPITFPKDGAFHSAEMELLKFLMDDPYDSWAQIFDDDEIEKIVAGATKIFQPHKTLTYQPLNSRLLVELVRRLRRRLPPISAGLDKYGLPTLNRIHISQTLYAGWMFWIGRGKLCGPDFTGPVLDFLRTNQLCDRALLQQHAINMSIAAGVP